jgi:hypothetical protein
MEAKMQGKAILSIEKRHEDFYATLRTSGIEGDVKCAFLVDMGNPGVRPIPTTGDFELVTGIQVHVWTNSVNIHGGQLVATIQTMGWDFQVNFDIDVPPTPQQAFMNYLNFEYGADVYLSSIGSMITYRYSPKSLYFKNLPIAAHEIDPRDTVEFQIKGTTTGRFVSMKDEAGYFIRTEPILDMDGGHYHADGPEEEFLGDEPAIVHEDEYDEFGDYGLPGDIIITNMDGMMKVMEDTFGPIPFGDDYQAPFEADFGPFSSDDDEPDDPK